MSRKLCEICNTRPVSPNVRAETGHPYCWPCNTEAEMENEHSDHAHDSAGCVTKGYATEAELSECWVCHPELNQANADYVARKGHSNGGRTGTYMSHKGCKHLRTPKAREACRREMKIAS